MPGNKLKELSVGEKQEIANYLLQNSKNGTLKKGFIKASAQVFGRSDRTISRIWAAVKVRINAGFHSISLSKNKHKCGRKRISRDAVKAQIRELPWNKKQGLRALSSSVGVSTFTLHKMIKEGQLKRTSTTLKPVLSAQNKISRR